MKVLGIDYGDRYIGLAETDPLEIISSALGSVKINSMKQAISECEAVIKRDGIGHIVIGLPLLPDGSEGDRAQKTRAFGRVLGRVSGLDVDYIDERYTTHEAEEILSLGNVKKRDMKKYTDGLAAQIILECWLNKKNTEK